MVIKYYNVYFNGICVTEDEPVNHQTAKEMQRLNASSECHVEIERCY